MAADIRPYEFDEQRESVGSGPVAEEQALDEKQDRLFIFPFVDIEDTKARHIPSHIILMSTSSPKDILSFWFSSRVLAGLLVA